MTSSAREGRLPDRSRRPVRSDGVALLDRRPAPDPHGADRAGRTGTGHGPCLGVPPRYRRAMSIRAVVWDVDDTLFDYTAADRAGMRSASDGRGPARRVRHRGAGPRALAGGHRPAVGAVLRGRGDLRGPAPGPGAGVPGASRADRRGGRRLVPAVHHALRGRLVPLPGRPARPGRARRQPPARRAVQLQHPRPGPQAARPRRARPLRGRPVRRRARRLQAARPAPSLRPARPWTCPRTRWPTSATTRRSTDGAPPTPGCSRCGSTATAVRADGRAPAGRTASPPSPNSPRSSARIPVLERRPPSGNVLPAPPESGPKGRNRRSETRTRSPSGACVPVAYGVIGSTTDSGSVSLGSSPGRPARRAHLQKAPVV